MRSRQAIFLEEQLTLVRSQLRTSWKDMEKHSYDPRDLYTELLRELNHLRQDYEERQYGGKRE